MFTPTCGVSLTAEGAPETAIEGPTMHDIGYLSVEQNAEKRPRASNYANTCGSSSLPAPVIFYPSICISNLTFSHGSDGQGDHLETRSLPFL